MRVWIIGSVYTLVFSVLFAHAYSKSDGKSGDGSTIFDSLKFGGMTLPSEHYLKHYPQYYPPDSLDPVEIAPLPRVVEELPEVIDKHGPPPWMLSSPPWMNHSQTTQVAPSKMRATTFPPYDFLPLREGISIYHEELSCEVLLFPLAILMDIADNPLPATDAFGRSRSLPARVSECHARLRSPLFAAV